MAGDWLKVEKATPDKPEILAIAALLNISPGEAFAKCFRFWAWADMHTTDGLAKGVTPESLDAALSCPHFARTLASVGWLEIRHGFILVPKFDRHMGLSEKQRLQNIARQRSHRVRNAKVTPERDTNVTPCISSSTSSVDSSLKGNGGVGERGETARDSPMPGQSWPSFLATEFAFWFRGTAKSQRDAEQLAGLFEAVMGRHAPEVILAGIRAAGKKSPNGRPERQQDQPSWDFVKWLDAREGKSHDRNGQKNDRTAARFRGDPEPTGEAES